jgi:hypothetical protein
MTRVQQAKCNGKSATEKVQRKQGNVTPDAFARSASFPRFRFFFATHGKNKEAGIV